MKLFITVLAALAVAGLTVSAQSQRPAPAAAVIQQYCMTCHNDRMKAAGLVLDPAEASRAGKPA